MTYADLQESIRILGLGDRSSLRALKKHHRDLVKCHHPDTGNTDMGVVLVHYTNKYIDLTILC